MQPVNIMLDLETLALEHNAAILSIGAAVFTSNEVTNKFHVKIDATLYPSRFHTSAETMSWWGRQNLQTRLDAFSGTLDPDTALRLFCNWCVEQAPIDKICLWANGADFDLPILKHACEHYNSEYPFDFRLHRCYRTLKSLVPSPLTKDIKNAAPHSALEDAVYQAKVASACLNYLTA